MDTGEKYGEAEEGDRRRTEQTEFSGSHIFHDFLTNDGFHFSGIGI